MSNFQSLVLTFVGVLFNLWLSELTQRGKEVVYECIQFACLYDISGGKLPEEKEFKMKAPGARHLARWMSKVIYTIKIAMFQDQLKCDISESLLTKIVDLARFLCLYYSMSSRGQEHHCRFKLLLKT